MAQAGFVFESPTFRITDCSAAEGGNPVSLFFDSAYRQTLFEHTLIIKNT